MSDLTKHFLTEFQDKETRHIYADDFLNTFIATQLKVLREEKGWTQSRLAEETGMKQERISVLEDINYESWTIKTLKRLAHAFDVRLSIKFETFGSFLRDFENFNRETLKRPSFEKDPVFVSGNIALAMETSTNIPAFTLDLPARKETIISQARSTTGRPEVVVTEETPVAA